MPTLNIALKSAIFESRKKQKRVAKLAGISETQLSHVVRGRRELTPKERARVASVLGKPEVELFPDAPQEIAATHSIAKRRLS